MKTNVVAKAFVQSVDGVVTGNSEAVRQAGMQEDEADKESRALLVATGKM